MKWPHLAPNSRRNTARALTFGTLAMVSGSRGRPPEEDLRKALTTWTFNRGSEGQEPSAEVALALTWLHRNMRAVGDLAQPAVARSVLDALTRRVDGTTAAAATVQRQRGVLVNLAEYAVERGLLIKNPFTALAWKAPRTVKGVDRRVVVNPGQARALLAAVHRQKPSGPSLVAFFGSMYFAALRPAEAATLRKTNLSLPAEGWGELLLESSTPEAGASWTDSGRRREERQLKHRAKGETRRRALRPGADGPAARAPHEVWHRARRAAVPWRPGRPAFGEHLLPDLAASPEDALTAEEAASPLARPALRPAARCGVDVAQRRGALDPGRRVGRPQRGRPAPDLRQVHRRAGGGGQASHRRWPSAGPEAVTSGTYWAEPPGVGGFQPDTAGQTSIRSWRQRRRRSEAGTHGGAPGGVRTPTGTLSRGLPLPVGLRGRGRECRRAPGPDCSRWRSPVRRVQRRFDNHDHARPAIDRSDPREWRSARRRSRGERRRLSRALLDLAGAAAPAAHAPAVAGVAAVGDPRSDRAGAAAAEAASVTVACRTGLHVARPPSGRVRGAVTGHHAV